MLALSLEAGDIPHGTHTQPHSCVVMQLQATQWKAAKRMTDCCIPVALTLGSW